MRHVLASTAFFGLVDLWCIACSLGLVTTVVLRNLIHRKFRAVISFIVMKLALAVDTLLLVPVTAGH